MKKKTETKKKLRSLQASETLYEHLYETAHDGILIIAGFPDGTITAANPAACHMLRSSEEEIRQTGINGLIDLDVPQIPAFFRKLARNDKRVRNEFIFLRKDGSKFPVEVSLYEIKDHAGCKTALLTIRNITELKLADEALKASAQKIVTILDSTTDLFVAWDRKGFLTGFNHQAEMVFGKKRDEVIGKHVWDMFPDNPAYTALRQPISNELESQLRWQYKEYYRIFMGSMETKKPVSFEASAISGKYYEVHAYPSQDGLSIYSRDITERKLAEKQLKLKTENLEEVNAALKVLLRQVEEGRADLEENVLSNIRELVLPYLNRARNCNPSARQVSFLNIAETNLNNIASSFLQILKLKYYNLTPREIEVATLVKEGKSIKEIAELLAISTRTVQFHRISLREKLGFKDRKSNLRSHLLSLQ